MKGRKVFIVTSKTYSYTCKRVMALFLTFVMALPIVCFSVIPKKDDNCSAKLMVSISEKNGNNADDAKDSQIVVGYYPVVLHKFNVNSERDNYPDIEELNEIPFCEANIVTESEIEITDSVSFAVSQKSVVIEYTDDDFHLCDVPLTDEQQRYVWSVACRYSIDPILMYGVMKVETRYQIGLNSKNGKYIGIMQIAKSNLDNLNKKCGITDLEVFEQNVEAGAYMLSYYYSKYNGDINKTLMCYHCGGGNARKQWDNGVTEDNYCINVREEIERIEEAYLVSLSK